MSGSPQVELAADTTVVSGLALSPGGRWLAGAAVDRKIRVWEPERSKEGNA